MTGAEEVEMHWRSHLACLFHGHAWEPYIGADAREGDVQACARCGQRRWARVARKEGED